MKITIRSKRKMPRVKPVFVMNESGVAESERKAVLEGIQAILEEAGVAGKIECRDFEVWNQGSGDYESVGWYVEQARKSGRTGQLNAVTIIDRLNSEPWRKKEGHYDVFVCSSDLWTGEPNINFVIGCARPLIGTVLSVARFRELDERMKYECVKTETIHEVGHVFGLLPLSRGENVEYSLGKHCANACTMRQGLHVPADWVRISEDRLKYGTFCQQCKDDLNAFFREG